MSKLQQASLQAVAALAAVTLVFGFVSGLRGPQLAGTYSGTVVRDTATSHTFVVPSDGQVKVTLTSLAVPARAVGLGLGTPTRAGNCQLSEAIDGAHVSTAIDETLAKGQYCVTVYDSGEIETDEGVAYTVSVAVP